MKEERKIEFVQTEEGTAFLPVKRKKKKLSKIAGFLSKIFKRNKRPEQKTQITEFQPQNPTILDYAIRIKQDKERLEELKEKYYQLANRTNQKEIAKIKKEILELHSSIELGVEYLKIKIKEIQASNMSAREKEQLLDQVYDIAGIEPQSAHMKEEPAIYEVDKNNYVVAVDNSGHYYIYIGGTGFSHDQRVAFLEQLMKEHPEIFTNGNPTIENSVRYFELNDKKVVFESPSDDLIQNNTDRHNPKAVPGDKPAAPAPKHMKEVEVIESNERQAIESAKHFTEEVKSEIISQLEETDEKFEEEPKGISK